MYYSAIGLLAVLVLLLENQDILLNMNDSFGMPSWRVYKKFLISVIIYYVTDVLWGIFEFQKSRTMLFADTFIYFIAMGIGVLFWTQYVVIYLEENNIFGRFLVYAGRIFAILVTAASFLNVFVPIIFTVDEKCVYHALGFRYFLLAIQIVLLALISVYAFISIIRKNKSEKKLQRYRTVVHFGVIMAVFLFAQLWFPYLPLFSIAYMLGTCLLRAFVISDEKEEYLKALDEAEKVKESVTYNRLSALSGDSICIYVINPDNWEYREFNANDKFKDLGLPKEGVDFFGASRQNALKVISPEDKERFINIFTEKNVLEEIETNGVFSMIYRIMMDNEPNYVQIKAAMVEEQEGFRLIVGIVDIDYYMKREEEYQIRLKQAQRKANIDALTGVRNKHAYLEEEERVNSQIKDDKELQFAIVILDLNDLKKINDTAGHKAGDEYIKEACRIICKTFKHSPVFRIGGDEFAVVVQGEDYESIDELVEMINDHNLKAVHSGGIVIACGMAKTENDDCVATVFERADKNMYENKRFLKRSKC